ncbi:WEB family protein At3g02930, chloroplastic-like [Lycium barbarum]|uniref:WEB family protein At3g02930, chloroplastic-like n=1 Tax=Lycium barbarum TaxID=112863 RepID=UPI00293F38AC|nr:WEB family protein At3g02930, chloroplastic-like [Lycium barbarum]
MQEQMGKFEEEVRQGLKAGELLAELKNLKELHSNTQEELKIKDNNIMSLKFELERAKQFQIKLTEKDDSLRKLTEELTNAKENEAHAMDLLSNFKKRVHELEAELANRRLSESKIFDSFEQTKIELEESKVELSSLHEEIESLESSSEQNRNGKIALEKELGCLRFELGLAKANLAKIQEREKFASSKAKALSDELFLLRNELKLATDAEIKSQKALDDLALALKEVATEAFEAKEKLSASQLELEQVKDEAGQLKHMVRNTEARYEKLLDDAKKENESLLAEAEEEKALAQHEAARLTESLKASKKEMYKLRGILKQAINEAKAAIAAAGLAGDENIQLKDSLAEKEESIRLLTRENERLRINEVAAHENVEELKRLLSSSSLKTEDKEQEEDPQGKKTSSLNISELNLQQEQENGDMKIQDHNHEKAEALMDSISDTNESPKSKAELHTPKQPHTARSAFSDDGGTLKTEYLCNSSSLKTEDKEQEKEHYEDPQVKKTSSLNIIDLNLQQEQESLDAKIQDKNPEKAEAIKVSHHRRATTSALSDDGGPLKTEDSDSDRSPPSRKKKKALFRRVGDLIRRKSFHKRESST